MPNQLGRLPLESVSLLDLSRVISGPYCTMMLGDTGGKVWKVEPPAGDETRGLASPYIEQVLHNKMLAEISHPTIGCQKMIGIRIRLHQNPGKIRLRAPFQGEHSREILQERGYPEGKIDSLIQKKGSHASRSFRI